MKINLSRILCLAISLCILIFSSINVSAESKSAEYHIDKIISYRLKEAKAKDVQDWINGKLSKEAGTLSEWDIINLAQSGKKYDFSKYEKALIKYLDKNFDKREPVQTKLNRALALVSTGSTNRYIYNIVNMDVDKKSVMGKIFLLHLINNGYESHKYSAQQTIKDILSLQLADGGWVLSPSFKQGDVDVTAMTLQALSPYYNNNSDVKNAIDKALKLLSEQQGENADFHSWGKFNCESTAQVLTALSSLGIDCKTDTRFIKNGKNIIDAVLSYGLNNGSYKHLKSENEASDMATTQAHQAFLSYDRMQKGKTPFFIMDMRNPSKLDIPKNENVEPSKPVPQDDNKNPSYTENVPPSTENTASDKGTSNKTENSSVSSVSTESKPVENVISGEISDVQISNSESFEPTASETDEKSEDENKKSYVLLYWISGITLVSLLIFLAVYFVKFKKSK